MYFQIQSYLYSIHTTKQWKRMNMKLFYLGIIHKWRHPKFPIFWPPSLPLSPQLSLENHPKLPFFVPPPSPSGVTSFMDDPQLHTAPNGLLGSASGNVNEIATIIVR